MRVNSLLPTTREDRHPTSTIARDLSVGKATKTVEKPTSPAMGRSSKTETLHKTGISPKQAENWEKLAAVPEEQFEAALADPMAISAEPRRIRAARPAGLLVASVVDNGPAALMHSELANARARRTDYNLYPGDRGRELR
jgi:hypothetical protein